MAATTTITIQRPDKRFAWAPLAIGVPAEVSDLGGTLVVVCGFFAGCKPGQRLLFNRRAYSITSVDGEDRQPLTITATLLPDQ